MSFSDTTPEIQAMQFEVYRKMSGEQKVLIALEMSLFARELRKAGIRQDHPDWSEEEVNRELLRLTFLPQPLPAGLR